MKELPIKFSVHKNPLKDKQGNTTYQVRPDTRETVTTKTLKEHREYYNLQDNFTLEGVVEWLKKEMVEQMSFNRRIHLQGIGTFWIKLGLKPIIDENGIKHKRIVTDPKAITGNEVVVTGVNFVPDSEFMNYALEHLVYFENSAPRGSVGHSEYHDDKELRQEIIDYLTEHKSITRPVFMRWWHVTRYRAEIILRELCEGENPILVREKQSHAFVYHLK